MFFAEEDLTLHITRGDTGELVVRAIDETTDGGDVPYIFKSGDVLRLKVFEKKNCENIVLQKDYGVEADTEAVVIALTETDTRIGGIINKPVVYWYEIELNPFTEPQTIVGYDGDGAKVFKLYPEGKDTEVIPPTPEELGIVDSELSLTSVNAVQNQAVTRAITTLKATVNANEENTAESFAAANNKISSTNKEVVLLKTRVNNLSTLKEGSTTADAELIDIRFGNNGNTYASAGDSVRNQFAEVKNEIDVIRTEIGNVDSELEDIRVGFDGVTYETAGDAVRTEVKKAKDIAQSVRDDADKIINDVKSNTETLEMKQDKLSEYQLINIDKIDEKADKTEIPTMVSELENDSGYLREHQSLDGLATMQDIYISLDGKEYTIQELAYKVRDNKDDADRKFEAVDIGLSGKQPLLDKYIQSIESTDSGWSYTDEHNQTHTINFNYDTLPNIPIQNIDLSLGVQLQDIKTGVYKVSAEGQIITGGGARIDLYPDMLLFVSSLLKGSQFVKCVTYIWSGNIYRFDNDATSYSDTIKLCGDSVINDAKKSDKTTYSSNKIEKKIGKLELIGTYTFAEDSSTTTVWSLPSNADYLGLSEVYIVVDLKSNANSVTENPYLNFWDRVSNSRTIMCQLCPCWTPVTTNPPSVMNRCIYNGRMMNGTMYPLYARYGNSKQYPYSINDHLSAQTYTLSRNTPYLNEIQLQCNGAGIGAGTEVTIYGVKYYK